MAELAQNAIRFLQQRFPAALVSSQENTFSDSNGSKIFKIWPLIALDSNAGIKQRAIAVKNLGQFNEINSIAQSLDKIYSALDSGIYIEMGNHIKQTGHSINSTQMLFAPRIIIYTNKLYIPIEKVISIFSLHNFIVDVVNESDMYSSLFISYGGPDEEVATKINSLLKARGIKTWFFPDDSLPGEKLHRMMHEGVNNHDRVLLICSEKSLTRPGVLNEIERVLEREAREGGSEILIPITIDSYVYSDWSPERTDIATQIRSRVVPKIEFDEAESQNYIQQIDKIAKVLSM